MSGNFNFCFLKHCFSLSVFNQQLNAQMWNQRTHRENFIANFLIHHQISVIEVHLSIFYVLDINYCYYFEQSSVRLTQNKRNRFCPICFLSDTLLLFMEIFVTNIIFLDSDNHLSNISYNTNLQLKYSHCLS